MIKFAGVLLVLIGIPLAILGGGCTQMLFGTDDPQSAGFLQLSIALLTGGVALIAFGGWLFWRGFEKAADESSMHPADIERRRLAELKRQQPAAPAKSPDAGGGGEG